MGNQIHCHVVKDEYAARVSNLHMYNAVRFVLEVVFKHVLNTVFDIVRHLVFFQLQGRKVGFFCTKIQSSLLNHIIF